MLGIDYWGVLGMCWGVGRIYGYVHVLGKDGVCWGGGVCMHVFRKILGKGCVGVVGGMCMGLGRIYKSLATSASSFNDNIIRQECVLWE